MKRIALTLCLACTVLLPAWASSAMEALDKLERQGRESPQPALAALEKLAASTPSEMFQRRIIKGLIHATNGDATEARKAADLLRQADPAVHGEAGLVASDMVLAQLAIVEAQPDRAASHAQSGLQRLEAHCTPVGPTCDWRRLWQLQILAGAAARARGLPDEAQRHAEAAFQTAKTAKDSYRQALGLIALALQAIRADKLDQAEEHLLQAQSLADQQDDMGLKVRVLQFNAELHGARRNTSAERAALREGLALAQSAKLTRQATKILVNLSDLELGAKRPAEALKFLEQAQRSLDKLKDRRVDATIHHNMGMARIALGQVAAGKRDIEAGLALWEGSGARDELASSLQEYSLALAEAGDIQGALSVYHRERKLKSEAFAADREASLAALQTRYNRDAQKREIELQARENAVQKAKLDNHAAHQRLWIWLAVVAGLIVIILALVLRRMRQTQHLLRRRQDDLRAQSEQDSLTGLANRRSLHRSIQAAQGAAGDYQGGVLLIDLDHFKRVNDDHGHGAGDLVLKEVARRLKTLLTSQDVVGRWGGEEFAIHLPHATPARTAQVAQAVLHIIGDSAVLLPSLALRVTASVGFGTYPLPQDHLKVGWEQALNLADMALYLAKSQGRNQALGLASVQADSPEALADIEADFESATRQGKAQLLIITGPEPHA